MTSTPESSSVPSQGDLFSLLDADNKHTVEETKALIHENLHSSRDPGLLNSMVEFYLRTRSQACLQILSGIHEARAQVFATLLSLRKMILITIDRSRFDLLLAICFSALWSDTFSSSFFHSGVVWDNERVSQAETHSLGHIDPLGSYRAETGKLFR